MDHGLTTEEYEKWIKSLTETQGYKKYLKYLREFFVQESYIEFRDRIRVKHGIPSTGYISDVPGDKMKTLEKDKELIKEIDTLIETYRLDIYDGCDLILSNILSNMTEPTLINTRGHTSCIVVDLANETKDPFSEKLQNQEDRLYPIAIRINPYATKRDVLDFVEKLFPTQIAHMQEEYRTDATNFNKNKTKLKNTQVIYDFIYKHKDHSYKELQQMVNAEFGRIFDHGEIGKIISSETKRRKQV